MAETESTRAQRGGAHGLAFSSLALAFALGPVVGGFIAAGLGLRAVFIVSSLLMLFTVLVIWRARLFDSFGSNPPSGASSAVSPTT